MPGIRLRRAAEAAGMRTNRQHHTQMNLPCAAAAQKCNGLPIDTVADEDNAFSPHRSSHRIESASRAGGKKAADIPIFHKSVHKRDTRLLRITERSVGLGARQCGNDVPPDRMLKCKQTARASAQRRYRNTVQHRIGTCWP